MDNEKKVSGQYGGQKYDGEKPDYTLVPPDAYKAVAEVMTAGAKKYSKNNWVNLELSRVIAALERHIEAFKSGEDYAQDSKQHHMAHAIANTMMAYHLCMNFPEQDDRLFKYILNKEKDVGPATGVPGTDDYCDCMVLCTYCKSLGKIIPDSKIKKSQKSNESDRW